MSYNLERHFQAERSRNVSRSTIGRFRRLRKEFIKYGKRRIQTRLYDFTDGEYVSEIRKEGVTRLRSYIE